MRPEFRIENSEFRKRLGMIRQQAVLAFAVGIGLAVLAPGLGEAQQKPSVASVLERQFAYTEQDFLSAAEAMPEDKYGFVPTNGEFAGVRTFGQQVKHVAVYNFRVFHALLGQAPPTDGENGPDALKTKAEILKYLRESFAIGHRAIAAIDSANMLRLVENSPEKTFDTPLDLVVFTCWHAYDHYGQMVEYLRMNKIVPPASRKSPPANPPSRPPGPNRD
jgi:hypothetical protein